MDLPNTRPDFEYETLAPDMIRLLCIDPRSAPNDIRCSIRHSKRDSELEEYVALSYCWGDPTAVADITINGGRLSIASNLHLCLRTLVSSWMTHSWQEPAGSLLEHWALHPIWIDAICINQQDVAEKSEQVQAMSDVYSSAWLVLSWLGQEQSYTAIACAALNLVDKRICDEEKKCKANGWLPWSIRYTNADAYCDPEDSPAEILELLRHEYFKRAWIVQEVLSAARALFISGKHSFSLCSIIMFHMMWRDHFTKVAAKHIDSSAMHLLRNRREEQTGHMAREHPCIYWIEILSDFRNHKCSDIRDKIFALSALPDAQLVDRGSRLLTDYTLTDEELYLAAIAYWETLLRDAYETATRRLAGPNHAEYAYSLIMEVVEVLRLQAVENRPIDWDSLKHRTQHDVETGKESIQVASGAKIDCSGFLLQDFLHDGPISYQIARPWRAKNDMMNAIEVAFQQRQHTERPDYNSLSATTNWDPDSWDWAEYYTAPPD